MKYELATTLAILAHIKKVDNAEDNSYKITSSEIIPYVRIMKAAGIRTNIRLRSDPKPPGAWSKELDGFLGRLEVGRYTKNNIFTKETLRFLQSLIPREAANPYIRKEIAKAMQVLEFDEEYILRICTSF